MERLTSIDPFIHHQGARTKILESSNEMLRSKFHLTVDQVENTIKPYKYEVECTEGEWKEGVKGSVAMLDRKLGEANAELAAIRSSIGRRRLRQAISYLQNLEQQQRQQHNRRGGGGGGGGGISGFFSSMLGLNAARSSSSSSTSTLSSSSPSSDASKDSSSLVSSPSSSVTTSSAPGNSLSSSLTPSPPPSPSTPPPVQESPFSDQTLHRAQQVLELQSYVKILQSRVSALKSRQCSTSSNAACCPEAYLEVVSDKLAYTAAMFIQLELLNEFFFQMPKELESQLYYGMRGGEVDKFAKENPVVKRHLECLHKKETLESVMNKLRGLM